MSSGVEIQLDPFDSSVIDEQTELCTLVRSLVLAEGFKMYFVRCNQPQQRQRLIAAIKEKLSGLNIREIHFSEPIPHLLDELRYEMNGQTPDAMFVSGIENSMPESSRAFATPFVANLNAARNSFPLVVRCPLVLWLPEYTFQAISHGAPDFFSVRSGAFFFSSKPKETIEIYRSATSETNWGRTFGLTRIEMEERILTIRNLIADYRAFPQEKKNDKVVARLLHQLGNLLDDLKMWSESEAAYQEALIIYQSYNDQLGEAQSLGNLGNVFNNRGNWAVSKEMFLKALTIFQECDDKLGEGLTFNNLGNVYHNQGKWSEAEVAYQKSLEIKRANSNQLDEGVTFNNLGVNYKSQGRWAEAETVYQKSLEIMQENGDRLGEAETLNNLGNIYHDQGKWTEAEVAFQKSLEIMQEYGDRLGESAIFNNLGLIYQSQGKWAEAEAAFQESLTISQGYNDPLEEGKTFGNLALSALASGNREKAVDYAHQCITAFEATEDQLNLKKARQLFADLFFPEEKHQTESLCQ